MAVDRPSDSFEKGGSYDEYMGRWSRLVARRFVAWPAMPGRRWLDVGCGTGALCEAILELAQPASVTGVEPSDGFLEAARRNLGHSASFLRGSATDIPLDDDSVDVVVSGLVLNFVDDKLAALREMIRVAVDGGTVGCYVWDYGGRMDILRFFWDEAGKLDPRARELDEGARFPGCRTNDLGELFRAVGFRSMQIGMIDITTPFASFDDYWRPFLGGQGPAPAYAMSLDEDARERLRQGLQRRIPLQADGTISMIARAWQVKATVTK